MKKLFDPKLIFLAIFLLLTIAIKSCENFQLRDLNDGGSETSVGGGVSGKKTTKIRFPFKKLKTVDISAENDDDDNDEDDNNDDDVEDSSEDSNDYTFAKVRKPTFEVKKRTNLRFSKLAQFRKPKIIKDNEVEDDDDDDDNENDESEEKVSFFSKILNFFKRKTREEKEEDDDEENDEKKDESAEVEDDDDDDDDDDDMEENKPFLSEVFEKIKDFLEAREKQKKISNVADDSDELDDEDDDDNEDDNEDDDDNDEEKESDEKTPESKRKSQIKESWTALFNRKPFNLIFDFNDSQDDEDAVNLEDSEEDEINYRRLLKEEQEHEREHTEQLIKQTSEEEAVKTETTTETPKQPSSKPVVKKKSKEEAHLAQKQFEKLLLNLPSFVPDYSKVKNPECQKQGEVFQRQLRGQRIWALQMMDANAKIPSGLMRGNTNQLGDFDLCTKISQKIKISESNNMKMKGKYCLANIDVVAAADQLKLPVHLIQGRNFIRSTINDPNHFFPRYSTINWGLCLPSACTYHDADQILESFIGPYNSTGIKLHINVNEDSCYVRQHVDVVKLVKSDWKIFGTCSLLLLIVAATFLATMNDYLDSPIFSSILTGKSNNDEDVKKRDESKQVEVKNGFANQILKCFSVKRNLTYLLTASDDDIKCLHGLKALSIVLLIISLKLIPMGRVPYSNRNKLTEFFNSPFSVFIRTSFLYEDVFFLISGLLTTFSILKIISCDKKSLWFRKVLMRVLRLVLPLIVVLLFYAFVWEHLGTGPQWSAVVDKNADLCKSNMWKNFLFIQNFYNIEDMCATHTYHLAVDMQLMILSPFLIFFIYKHPSFGLGLYGILHALSAAARFSSTVDNRLSVVVFHGMKLSQLYRTFNMTFSVALHRLTPYLSGISLGILIKEYGRVKLPFGVAISGWISTLCGFIWCFYTPSNLSHKDYQYDPTTAAQYSAMSPMIWSISIAWIIFACYSDASWKLNDILSSRPMIFLSRISYSLYLVVFLVFFYFSGSHKSSEEFYISSYIDRLELFIVFTAAICFTLCVDLPFKNITKLLFDCEHHEKEPTSANQESSEVDFESPFADDEDDFVFRRTKLKHEDNSKINTNGEHLNGSIENETEEEKPRKSSKFENNMNARRWKWEILDE